MQFLFFPCVNHCIARMQQQTNQRVLQLMLLIVSDKNHRYFKINSSKSFLINFEFLLKKPALVMET